MTNLFTSDNIARRAHEMARDTQGYKTTSADTSTTVGLGDTYHNVFINVRFGGFLRTAYALNRPTLDKAVEDAFVALENIIESEKKQKASQIQKRRMTVPILSTSTRHISQLTAQIRNEWEFMNHIRPMLGIYDGHNAMAIAHNFNIEATRALVIFNELSKDNNDLAA